MKVTYYYKCFIVKSYTILRELDKGKFFGEIALLTNLKTTASVYCLHYVTCG